MTTETKNNETKSQASEQSTFAPLGKYAAIAVVMVGVIVTTAIMLDKQLNKTETEIASIEDEVSKLNKAQAQAKASKVAQSNDQAQITASATTAEVKADTATLDNATDALSTTSNQQSADVTIASSEDVAPTTAETDTDTDTHQSRIVSHKAKQKTRMTEIYARINQRESKQLEQFKTQQAEQVARLRNRVNVQQQQIDALIQRNENLFNLRSASVQRNQTQREQMLNRI